MSEETLWKNNNECPSCGQKIEDLTKFRSCETGYSYCSYECVEKDVNENFDPNDSLPEKRWKLEDYPNCMICEHSEQYQDDTFICCFDENDPEPSDCCDSLKIAGYYVGGAIAFILGKLKDFDKRIKKIESTFTLGGK